MNKKFSRIDAEVQARTGKKNVVNQNSPYKANAFHSYEKKITRNALAKIFLSPGNRITFYFFITPQSLLKHWFPKRKSLKLARTLKAGGVGKEVSLAGSPPAGIPSPGWAVFGAGIIPCHMPSFLCCSDVRSRGAGLTCQREVPPRNCLMESSRRGGTELNCPCLFTPYRIAWGRCVHACVCVFLHVRV